MFTVRMYVYQGETVDEKITYYIRILSPGKSILTSGTIYQLGHVARTEYKRLLEEHGSLNLSVRFMNSGGDIVWRRNSEPLLFCSPPDEEVKKIFWEMFKEKPSTKNESSKTPAS